MGIYTKEEEHQLFNLGIDDTAKGYLLETARWGKFMGVITAILLLLFTIFLGIAMVFYMPPAYTAVYGSGIAQYLLVIVVVLGVDFYPVYAIIKAASLIKKGINFNDQLMFNNGLRFLKNVFRYLGIITILLIIFYGVILVVSFLSALV